MRVPRRSTVLGLLALLAAALGLLAAGLFPQEPLRRFLETRLRQSLGPGARVGRIHVVPGRLRASLEDVVVETPGLRVEVPRARLELGLTTLTGGAIGIRSLEVDEPRILLRASASPSPAAPAAMPRPLLVERVVVRGGQITVEQADRGGLVRLRGLDLEGSIGSGSLEVRVAGGEWQRASPLPLGPAHARLRISPYLALELDDFDAGTTRSRIRARGSLGSVATIRPDLRFEADLDLDELSAIAGLDAASGRLGIEGRFAAGPAGLELDAEATPSAVTAYGVPVDGGHLHVLHRGGETTASPTLSLLGGTLSGEARLSGDKTRGELRVAGLDAARLRAVVPPSAPALSGSLDGRLSWSGPVDGDVSVRLHLESQGRAATLASIHARADVEGDAAPSTRRIQARWSASLQGEGVPGSALATLAAEAEGSFRLGGALVYQGHAAGSATVRTPAGTRDLTLEAQASGEATRLGVAAEIHGLGGRLILDGDAEGSTIRSLTLRGEGLDLAAAIPEASGGASFRVESSGPLARMALRGEGRIEGLEWRKAPLGPIELELRGDSRSPELSLRAPALQATAEARLNGPHTLQASIVLSGSPLAPFASLAPTPVSGSVSGTVRIDAPMAHPGSMRVEARIEAAEVAALGSTVRTARPASAVYDNGRLTLTDLGLVGDGLHLDASGTLAAARPETALHVSGSVDLEHLPGIEGWKLAGRVEASLEAAGTLRRPQLAGSITAGNVSVSGPKLAPLAISEGRIELAGDSIVVPGLAAGLAGGQLTLTGRVPLAAIHDALRRRKGALEADEEASLRLAWTGVQAGALLEKLRPGSSSSLTGALAGDATLEGGLRSIRELRAHVSVPRTTLVVDDLPADVGPVNVDLRDGVATVAEAVVATQGGSVSLHGSLNPATRTFDASAAGRLDLRSLSPLLGAARLTGIAELDLSASGAFDAPRALGTLSVADATLRVRDIPQTVTDIRGRLVFDQHTVKVEEAAATLGGGPLAVSGSASLGRKGLSDVDLTVTGKDMALRYPLGLTTKAGAELRLRGRPGALRLEGAVKTRGGRYDLDLVLRQSLRRTVVRPTASPLLRSISLDVGVDIESPVAVKSTLADVRVGGRLSMLGDLESPEPYGQLDLEDRGRVYLQGRTFEVDRGSLIYEGTWDPSLDVSVTSRIQESGRNDSYSVKVTATGTLASPNLAFDSVPKLSDAQVQSLIATGTLDASTVEATGALAGDQAAMLFAGRLGRGIAGSLGLDQLSIQPQLLSREQDPGANFVFGKRLTRNVMLAYSLSLNDPENRFIQLTAEPGKRATGLVQLRDDGTYTVGAGQRLELGGPRRPPLEKRGQGPRLEDVRLEGDLPFPEDQLRKVLGLHAGSRASSWDVQEKAERLRQWLIDRGYMEAEVAARLESEAAVFKLQAGPRYRWVVEGMSAPPSLDRTLRSAFFADEALDLGRQRLLREMRSRGHLRADVLGRAEDEAAGKVLVFTVTPGPRYDSAVASFPGASAIPESRLLGLAGGPEGLLGSEPVALEAIRAAYAEIHRLAAEVGPVALRDQSNRLLIEVPIREGPTALLAAVSVAGSTLPADETSEVLGLRAGTAYDDAAVAAAGQRLRDRYLGLGYPKVRVTTNPSVVGPDVEVVYRVLEGPQLVVGSVEIEGASRTRSSLILGKVDLKPGAPLDLRKLIASERKLRDLALFRRVAISYSEDSPSTVRIEVEEQASVAAGYQLRYNEDDGLSGELDGEARNLAGTGLTLGARYRRGADVEEERGSLDLPSFFRGRFNASVFRLFEELPATDAFGESVTDRRTQRGFQLQQSFGLGNRWGLLVGYRLKHVLTESPVIPFPLEQSIAAVDVSLLRETRDNPLDSRRGRFWSFNLELSPKSLGSDLTFVKGFAQAFFSRALGPSLTWAQGYRLGLATGFNGQDLVSSERFTAGGANSLRGFETDSVGPRNDFGDPTGGEAVLILNQELRLHHRTGLGAAAFYDGGNVFASVKDMNLDLRHVLGAGIRYVSPVGLLRLDLGFPLFRKPGEKAYQLFFSFGQAF